mgnify:CR=1 FL=1
MKLNEEDDFGFSLVSESELKAHEDYLKKQVEEQSKIVQQTSEELTDKLHGLKNMIMPLLNNLAQSPYLRNSDPSYVSNHSRRKSSKLFRSCGFMCTSTHSD